MTFYVLGKGNAAGALRQTLAAKGMAVSAVKPSWGVWPANRRIVSVLDVEGDGAIAVSVGRSLDAWETKVIESLIRLGLSVLVKPIETSDLTVTVPAIHTEAASVALYRAMTSA